MVVSLCLNTLNRSYLGESQLLAFQLETCLCVGERLVPTLALESIPWRLARFDLLEKALKALSSLRKNSFEVAFFLLCCQHSRLIFVAPAYAFDLIGSLSAFQGGAIEMPASIQGLAPIGLPVA